MTEDQANEAIGDALGELGPAEKGPPDYFQAEKYAGTQWEPTYIWRAANVIWAIELSRGDRIPEATIKFMIELREIDPNVKLAFFVPEREPQEHLRPVCQENGIALIAKTADHYEVLGAASLAQQPTVARIPDWVIQRLKGIQHLEPKFRSAITSFCKKYERLSEASALDDDSQEQLLRRTFASLLKTNRHFAAEYTPLDLLRFFEQNNLQRTPRDHYFHTFNNFLLGCIILDECHEAFEDFRRSSLRAEYSSEYVWLLTVLFHDVGYPIQRRDETIEMIYGVPGIGADQANAEKRQAWDSPQYRISRAQLVSLYDHLTRSNIDCAWSADPFGLTDHPLDRALERSFLEKGHGAASCMRMLAGFFGNVSSSAEHRQFLIRHVFLAGLSIPFHDWPVRKFLCEVGIPNLRTSRFPFASLLMFVDSIQEDRRGDAQAPDILTGINVQSNHVQAQIRLNLLSEEKFKEKKREARDVKSFLQEDLLYFDYPQELLL